MAWEICFKLATGQEICVPIPVLMRHIPTPEPDPGPWIATVIREWLKPQPDPWLAGELLQDIVVLTTMHTLAAQLSPEIKATTQRTLQATLNQHRLPEGVRLHMHEERAQM
jgi:hypothetical protein